MQVVGTGGPELAGAGAAGPAPHAADIAALLSVLGTDAERGLSESSAADSRRRHGPNRLAEAPPVPWWRRLLAQFRELVIGILIAAAIISGAMGEWADTLAILAIVALNGLLGFFQEERAGRALAALRRLSAPTARVVRDGVLRSLPARDLVPGDVIELEAGDSIPADARLIRGYGFRAQEAALTGESAPAEKDPGRALPEATPLGDRRNMAYMGTVVAAGKARAVVVATGMATELGRIAGLLRRAGPEPTPLQRRLAELGKVLVAVCLAAVAVIFALQVARGDRLVEAFLRAVSLAVAAVPEGLPAVVTLALALGLQRMARRNALVRKLPSVETLGSVTVICSDKTGTLTRNEMTVREVEAAGRRYRLTGAGYEPRGRFFEAAAHEAGQADAPPPADSAGRALDPRAEPDLVRALTIAARCNNARVVPPGDGRDGWHVVGDPTEGALAVAAMKAGIGVAEDGGRVLCEIPFDSERKAMSVVVGRPDGSATMFTKGAPEVVLGKCGAEWRSGRAVPLAGARRAEIARAAAEMASRALRVLGLADRRYADAGRASFEEADLTFAGLVGMIDPPRDEAREAVRRCRAAGIRPVMITGDHPDTARAIARELRLAGDGDGLVTGPELDAMSDEELSEAVDRVAVYARVSAEHKLRVVRAWKGRGQVVAMTGDGVNDAPAVEAADIGIAMGISGTEVTKEASAMVLVDDNFASIVAAVEEGRGIFDNVRKFVHYLLSCNAGEVLFMLFAALVGWPAPLTAIQILWINLVTDGLPALALGMEPPEPDVMGRPPRPPRRPVITARDGLLILVHGLLIAAATAAAFALAYRGGDLAHARTTALLVLAFAQLFYSFGCRSRRYTLPELGLFSNSSLTWAIAGTALLQAGVVAMPFTRSALSLAAHPLRGWAATALLALLPVTIIEVTKLIQAALARRPARADAGVPTPDASGG
jgi:P-type Ca2+ transporter type 2C